MNKKVALLLSALVVISSINCTYAASSKTKNSKPHAVINQETISKLNKPEESPISTTVVEFDPKLYPNPNLNHAVGSYKSGNYTGAIQELLSYIKKFPLDAKAYYYAAMTFANLGDSDAAIAAYEKVPTLTTNEALTTLSAKGRDCLIGGPLCATAAIMEDEEPDPLDEFINAPYGDGFSPELKEQMKVKELENIQEKINRKQELNPDDVQKIKDFDKENSSQAFPINKLAMANGEVSNDEIVSAINTLRQAGMTVSIQPSANTVYQNPQMAEMSMMLGGNNHNNDPMAQMLPYMMQAGTKEGAQNLNPQVIQAMMMNSMMSNFDFNTSDNR